MPANTKPIFPLVPVIGFARLTAANTATDGTGVVATLFPAGAEGARLDTVTLVPSGTNVATVLRLFLNNGNNPAVAANNTLFKEIALPATTASASRENGQTVEVPIDRSLPPGWRLTGCLGTAAAGGWAVTATGGDY